MKKILSLGMILFATSVAAQNTYTNAEISSTNDVIGTARYVGMGGAMGALGADISAISSNPAAIGMYRKNDVALTAGVTWPKDRTYDDGDALTKGTFDQMGFVTAWQTDSKRLKFVNFAFNYQKKMNFNSAYYADNGNTKGLSQMDQLANIANSYYSDYNLMGTAYNAWTMDDDDLGYYNAYSANSNQFSSYTTGSVQAFDLNLSFNTSDRVYYGFTLGCDNVDYNRYTTYTEFRDGDNAAAPIQDYTLYNDKRIDGYGINFKAGVIVRPIEENPFRVGLAVETPTWYSLKSSAVHSIDSKYNAEGTYQTSGYYNHAGYDDSYLEYNLRTPWRARVSLGSTVGTWFAWGAEYEYANYSRNNMSYDDEGGHTTRDKEMNRMTKNCMQAQHSAKVGFEFKPSSDWALRLGYNYYSPTHKSSARLDSGIDSYAMDYITSTDYMNLKGTNILTLGAGYKYKRFYVDLVYKIRNQKGDFYAFDDSFSSDEQFVSDNPGVANQTLDPVDVNLTRHTITCTLGFKF